ncbi:MAG: PIN domain-containing protein [Protaetiibacter sp.]
MIVVDVNVLVAAHLSGHPHHPVAHRYLTEALSDDTVLVPDAVWSGFLRIATSGRIFDEPSSISDAAGFVRSVVAAPGYRHIGGLLDGIEPFLALSVESGSAANLIPDAYIAAVAISHDAAVVTFDRDFRRFDGLRIHELRS